MKLFVMPVPLFDKDLAVNSYCIEYRNAENLLLFDQLNNKFDNSINSQIIDLLNKISIETFTNGKPIFVPISNLHLLSQFYETSKTIPSKVILKIDNSVTTEDMYINRIIFLKDLGYKFAFKLSKSFENCNKLISFMDYLIVDQVTSNKKKSLAFIEKYPDVITVASNINTYNMFKLSIATKYNLFEGKFYRVPLTIGETEISPIKGICIELINSVKDNNFDINVVSKVIEKDTSLSISLLKLVNSQYINSEQKINTITQAAAMIGQNEIRKWASAAASTILSADKPNEINRLSLIRAKFAENLAPIFGLESHSQSLFLMGLFSVLDVVLEKSINEALSIVSVSDNIKDALVYDRGPYFPLFEFMSFYEIADWSSVSRILIIHKLDVEDICEAYINTLIWYKNWVNSYTSSVEK